MGLGAELRHNPAGLAKKVVIGAVAIGLVAAFLRSRRSG
jgi:hypothetical protein